MAVGERTSGWLDGLIVLVVNLVMWFMGRSARDL